MFTAAAFCLLLVETLVSPSLRAENYPARAVKIVVPIAAGDAEPLSRGCRMIQAAGGKRE